MNQIENAGTMWAKLGHTKKRKMPLSYLRGIFERCLAHSRMDNLWIIIIHYISLTY